MGTMKDEYIMLQNEQGRRDPIVYCVAFCRTRKDARKIIRRMVENGLRVIGATEGMRERYKIDGPAQPFMLDKVPYQFYWAEQYTKYVIFHRERFDKEYSKETTK